MEKLLKFLLLLDNTLSSESTPVSVKLFGDFSGEILDYKGDLITLDGIPLEFNSEKEFLTIYKKFKWRIIK